MYANFAVLLFEYSCYAFKKNPQLRGYIKGLLISYFFQGLLLSRRVKLSLQQLVQPLQP